MIRSLVRLQQNQATILAEYREEATLRQTAETQPGPGGAMTVTAYARVSAIVTEDPAYGAHLRVVRQRWTGTPPTLIDAPAPEARCYPAPNHGAADYVIGEVIRMAVSHGALIAERLA